MYNLIITKNSKILLTQDDTLVEEYEDTDSNLEGNIYIGKVQNILPKLDGAFINIGEEKNALIHNKDILDKNLKLKPGQPLLVQIKKDSIGTKGARVTTDISLAGKYIVLLPFQTEITISNKITENEEKQRLKSLVKTYLKEKKQGAIIRTAAQNIDQEELIKEIKELQEKWNLIQNNANKEYPKKIYETPTHWKQIIRSLTGQIEKIITDDEDIKNEIKIIEENVEVEIKERPITDDLQKQIDNIKKRKIWLKCGGFIVIDKTEALISIDVNSGKYTGKKTDKEVIFTVNKEATIEIAKQIRLRNLRGIIIIDYINMDDKQKEEIQNLLENKLKEDRAKTQIYGFSKLNLFEMTRKNLNR